MAADGRSATHALAAGLGRAFGGALIFGLPMLMTNELWELGAAMNRLRLALLLLLSVPLLVGVAHRIGFESSFGWREDLRDACIALGVGLVAATVILTLFNLLRADTSVDAVLGRIGVQAVPTALGALLARSQFGRGREDDEDQPRALGGYAGALFLMLVGALFLSLNTAPTEEMIEIAYMMTPWHSLGLVTLTIVTMHAFVVGGSHDASPSRVLADFARFTLVGYLLGLAISLFALWVYGRTDAVGLAPMLRTTLVLGFPAGLGAAAARLIL
jgi:putative integral membrane protein (TIGR02587 family)